jgi:RNA binding exosome subunit
MARPIEATPIVTGKDAEKLLKEIDQDIVLTSEKKKELDKCHALYLHFSKQKLAIK